MRRVAFVLAFLLALAVPANAAHIHSSAAERTLERMLDQAGNITLFTVFERAAPAVSAANTGSIYFDATANKFRVSEHGGAFADLLPAGGAAPTAATYITQTANATLSAEQALSGLTADRLLRNTTGGVLAASLLQDNGTNLIVASGDLLPTTTITKLGGPSNLWASLYMDFTNTATVGAVTINKPSGRVRIAAAGTSVVVTNSLVTAASHVFAVMSNADATGRVTSVVPAAGSFTINTVAVTAEATFDFLVINAD